MSKTSRTLLFVLAGALLFNFLFWQEKMGLNTSLFGIFYLIALWVLFPEARKSKAFLLTGAGVILSGAMVVVHNSGAAKFTFWLSTMCAAGFAQEPGLRFLLGALGQYLTGWYQTPRHLMESLDRSNGRQYGWGKKLGLSILPLIVVAVFYLLYYAANEQFAHLADRFWAQVGRVFSLDISWPQLLFLVLGFFITGAAFWRNQSQIAEDDRAAPLELSRIRPSRKRYVESRQMLGLKKEFQQSGILLWLLNGLLLLVNLTDFWYVWFGFDQEALLDLKGYVHEGTYFLIASILLAMGVLFFVFRKNINFYPNYEILKKAAAFWMIQNAVLAMSVAIRNARYIEYHGLAYKRIGVIFFLLLVFYGLFSLYQKIMLKKTLNWLLIQNAWALYLLLVLNSCVAWDALITRYNLSNAPKGAVDVRFMIFEVSDLNLHLLEKHLDELPGKNMYPQISETEIREAVAQKRQYFELKMSQCTWKSWNLGDLANAR